MLGGPCPKQQPNQTLTETTAPIALLCTSSLHAHLSPRHVHDSRGVSRYASHGCHMVEASWDARQRLLPAIEESQHALLIPYSQQLASWARKLRQWNGDPT